MVAPIKAILASANLNISYLSSDFEHININTHDLSRSFISDRLFISIDFPFQALSKTVADDIIFCINFLRK